MNKTVIVGFGAAGKNYFNLLQKNKLSDDIYIIDEKLSKEYLRYKITLEEIENKNIFFKYAIVATPSNLHFKFAEFFLKRKSNVLIEKPFVLKISDGEKLIKLSKKVKRKCWTCLQNRYNVAVQELKKTINKNLLGNIFFINCTMFWKRSKDYYSSGWRGKYKSDGGVLANQGIHLLDILVYLFGEVISFSTIADFNKNKLEAEDLIIVNSEHKNRVFSVLTATTRADKDYQSSIEILGTKGRARVTGISLNIFEKYKINNFIKIKAKSENFITGRGPIKGMGNGHQKVLKEFYYSKISSKSLEIDKNIYIIKMINSIYNVILSNKKIQQVKNKQSILGK